MNKLKIARLAQLPVDASLVPQQLDTLNVAFVPISTLNWPDEYPYSPEASFRMAWCPDGLVLHYRVHERSVRARYADDGGKVWTDSCAECFIRNADSDTYYNIECNCIGTLLSASGNGRHHRVPVAAELMQSVSRWASLGHEPFEERLQPTSWEVALVIPSSFFASHPLRLEAGATLRANFYKCGDELSVPHFISWNPIEVAQPDFHRPEYFGELELL